jgi:hypothetical protein
MNGASWAQAAGVALGESQTLTRAARMVTRLPGLRDSELEEVADHFVEGAATRQVARNVPLVGRVSGPVVGAALLSDRNPDHAYEDEEGRLRQPMLVPAVGSVLSGLTQGPRWKRKREADDADDAQEGGFIPVAPVRMGTFTPIAPVPISGETRDRDSNADDIASRQRSDYVMQEGGEEMEQHIAEVVGSKFPTSRAGEADAGRLDSASSRLERAADQTADRLSRAAEGLERAARQQQMQAFEGRLNVAGPMQVAGTMGDVIALLQAQKGSESLKGVDNFTLAGTMAQALGVTPVENGKPPVENDLARFGVFANQALTMGLSHEQTERVVREVKESPEAQIQPETRAELVGQMYTERHLSWDDANQEVDRLEHSARLLPNEMSAYGVMNVPAASPAAPVVNVEPQVDVRPNVQVTLEAPQDSAYAQGLQEQASLTGSEATLTSSVSAKQEGEEA